MEEYTARSLDCDEEVGSVFCEFLPHNCRGVPDHSRSFFVPSPCGNSIAKAERRVHSFPPFAASLRRCVVFTDCVAVTIRRNWDCMFCCASSRRHSGRRCGPATSWRETCSGRQEFCRTVGPAICPIGRWKTFGRLGPLLSVRVQHLRNRRKRPASCNSLVRKHG